MNTDFTHITLNNAKRIIQGSAFDFATTHGGAKRIFCKHLCEAQEQAVKQLGFTWEQVEQWELEAYKFAEAKALGKQVESIF